MRLLLILALAVGALEKAEGAVVSEVELGSSASEDTCRLTTTATSFAASTRQVFLRFTLRNLRAADRLSVDWLDPKGNIASSAPYDDLPVVPSLCLLAQLPVGGFAPAKSPGNWTVRVTANGGVLASRTFRIVADSTPGGPQITRITQREKSPQVNELIVEGEGFNIESIVHVAQYTSSTGWKFITNGFPETLAPTRLTVTVGALKPAEYVVFVKNGEMLSAPGRFLIATPGYKLPFPPNENWVISQPPYGMYSHWGRTVHSYDIAPRGTGCVVAMRPGIAYTSDLGYGQTPHLRIFGNYVTVEHEDGDFSHYAHLRSGTFRVKNGERVEQGQALAVAGTSGYSFGVHVHVQVTRSKAISTQSIPFLIDDLPAAQRAGYRGSVASTNRSAFGSCSGPKPDKPTYLMTSTATPGKPAAATVAPAWSAQVPVAGWWSDFTQVTPGAKALEIKLGWDSAQRDLDLHLVSPSGKHYGSYGDHTGYRAADGTEESFTIDNPEAGTWRVSVQGMKGNGESMPFRVYRNVQVPPPAPASAWGGARRRR